MSGNMHGRDLEYYERRERQEREHAARTDDMIAKRLHLEMADRYSNLLQKPAANPRRARA
jgi:hypothetical protein